MKWSKPVKKVLETGWFSIDAIPSKSTAGKPYYRLSCDDSVEILAVTSQQEIILVRQFRPAVEMLMLELPAGYVNQGESNHEAVQRELWEETRYVCDSVSYLGAFKIAPSRINNTLHLFCGKEARLKGLQDMGDSESEVVLVTQDEFRKLIDEGKFLEVAGITTYYLAQTAGLI